MLDRRLFRPLKSPLWTVAFASAWVSGCGLVFEYPDPVPETTALLCSDGVDNDYDGEADCRDVHCDGFCREESPDECNDQRDNDGDGLVDATDPRCWLIKSPHAASCAQAEGVDLLESFDTGPFGTATPPWWLSGVRPDGAECVACADFWNPRAPLPNVLGRDEGSQNAAVTFRYNTTEADTLDDNLGLLARRDAFSGSFEDFEFSFVAAIQPQTLLRAAIIPIDVAPAFAALPYDAERASLALTIDATAATPSVTLTVDGAPVSKALPYTQGLCEGTLCSEATLRADVTLDERGVRLLLRYPEGAEIELRAPPPASRTIPPSRLAFWGGSTTPTSWIVLDDVRLRVLPALPCGAAVPQIPGAHCEFVEGSSSFGHSVSLARGADGEYCALVAASRDAGGPADALTTWRSRDGGDWLPVAEGVFPDLPAGAVPIGAGLAARGSGFRAAVGYRRADSVYVALTDADGCGGWGALAPEHELFPDAEAPSYVNAAAQGEIYFTRPPGADATRTLWRLAGAAPELVATLPADVGAPVSVAAVGARDLVLVYPREASDDAGVGMLVGASGSGVWRSVAENPVLRLGATLGEWDGRLRFDDRGVAAAALSFGPDGGFLFYAGRTLTADRRTVNLLDKAPLLSVGTAWFAPADQTFPELDPLPEPRCGNGRCEAPEDCGGCPADCSCSVADVDQDALGPDFRWGGDSDSLRPGQLRYATTQPPALNFSGGEATWSTLTLERPLSGDFELSFDLLLAETVRENVPCTYYVGLGSIPELAKVALGGRTEVPQEPGLFARFGLSAYCGGVTYSATPFVLGRDERRFGPFEEAPATATTCAQALRPGVWQHVVLRRENSRVTVLLPRQDGCGVVEQALTYTGELSRLPSIAIGQGGRGFEKCERGAGGGRIENLRLSRLHALEPCEDGREDCSTDDERASCVDLSASAEHCGACGRRCAANEECQNGHCGCSALPGILECDGACVDSATSKEHCGACGARCDERCVGGTCDPVLGDCAAPLPVPPEGGSLAVDFFRQGDALDTICDRQLFERVILEWTPRSSGKAFVAFDRAGGVIGVSDDPKCEAWLACSDDSVRSSEDAAEIARFEFVVEAGKTYRLGLGRSVPAGETNARFGVEVGLE